jgi:DNA-binding SARP family transcriptional activator
MLVARISPPLPDRELPQQLSIQRPAGHRLFEIVTRPGGLLVRRLAADLADMGYEVAWVRPLPFEPDPSSLGALLLMALATARRSSSRGKEPLVVVESPTAAQAETLLGQLLVPGALAVLALNVLLVMDAQHRTSIPAVDSVLLEVPSWSPRLARGLVPEQGGHTIPLSQLSHAAGGLAGLIDSAVRAMPQLGAAELAHIVAKTRGPAALTRALASRVLAGASAERLAALEMAGRLGYAHPRYRSLRPAVAGSAEDPWWIPLTVGWLQVNPAWREALVTGPTQAPSAERSACLNRLVADLVDDGAIHEAIELCINAGWHGLAADLLAGEAEQLVSSGRYATLTGWLDRLPAQETRGHPSLAALIQELQRTAPHEDQAAPSKRVWLAPATPSPGPRRHWPFRRSSHSRADTIKPPPPPGLALLPATAPHHPARLTGDDHSKALSPTARTRLVGQDVILPGGADLLAAHAPARPRQATLPAPTPGIGIDEMSSARAWAGNTDATAQVRVDARLLGPFELHVEGQPVRQWRGNRGRMLLAYLLLHRARPVSRDVLGGVFWPEAAPDVARNRLHVALYGLRRDLRAVSQHPIVAHGQGGFSLHPGVGLWLDTEAFGAAVSAAQRDELSRTEVALGCYETALELYRGDLLEDAPFEEWALLDREQLRVQHLETLDRVARMRFELGRYTGCIEVCQHLVTGDSCREDIHRLLMRCYARLNKPHLAVHQYHQCERQLRGELGLKPAEATQKLYEQIRRRQPV